MERLWAPWRIEYIRSEKDQQCIFCTKAAERQDRQNLILCRGTHSFVILNRYPYNNGHLMVAPYAHVASLEDLDTPTLADLMCMVKKCLAVLRRAMRAEAFNIGVNLGQAAGAGIADHVHIHVVPRWAGDTNFMTVLADIRVLPDALDNTYETLLQALQELERNEISS